MLVSCDKHRIAKIITVQQLQSRIGHCIRPKEHHIQLFRRVEHTLRFANSIHMVELVRQHDCEEVDERRIAAML